MGIEVYNTGDSCNTDGAFRGKRKEKNNLFLFSPRYNVGILVLFVLRDEFVLVPVQFIWPACLIPILEHGPILWLSFCTAHL